MFKLLPITMLFCLGCQSAVAVDPYVVKCDKVWPHTIADPYLWSAIQIDEAAPIGPDKALCMAEWDVDSDQQNELLVRADVPAGNHLVLVFRQTPDGYQYVKQTDSKSLSGLKWRSAHNE